MRYISDILGKFTESKFVLLSGPRQVGKTTMAKEWLSTNKGLYLNWDVATDRAAILRQKYLLQPGVKALVFDELHKYQRWKGYLKGLYDAHAEQYSAVITGSARLDIFQKGGDSLLGRYEYLRLHPFSVGELSHGNLVSPPTDWLNTGKRNVPSELWGRLEQMTGFPEPYSRNDRAFLTRWSTRRRSLLLRQDIRDISDVRMLSALEEMALLLPERVGSLLSINSLSEDVQVAFETVSHWLTLLERLYLIFMIKPYSKKIVRSLKKARKMYLWDWSEIEDPGAKFENMVALHLLKSVHAWSDVGFGEYDLNYWRDRDSNEVDFIITLKRKPVCLIECRLSDTQISPSLRSLSTELGNIPGIQLLRNCEQDFVRDKILVTQADRYLANLV